MFEGLNRTLDTAFLRLMERSGADTKITNRVVESISAQLQPMIDAEIRKNCTKTKDIDEEQKEFKKRKSYVFLLAALSILLAAFGVGVYYNLPDPHQLGVPLRVQEAVGYLAYLFPLYAVLVAGRGLIVTDKNVNPENQAIVAFIQSLIFVVAGACAQMGYQLRENGPWLLLSLKCLLYLLVAALLIQAFYYYRLIRNSRSQNKTIAKYTFITEVVVSVFIVLIGLWSFDQLRTSQALAENPNESTETSKWYNYRFVIEPASLSGVTAISGCNCSIRTSADAHESHKR